MLFRSTGGFLRGLFRKSPPSEAYKQFVTRCLKERGYDPVLGARPLRRTIQREIEDVLSEKILFGELKPGQIVVIDVEGEGKEAKLTFAGNDRSPFPDVLPAAN